MARRREIAHAAAKVFNQRGFRGTSFGAVAEELGIDRATLYYYIGSKEELFDEVVRDATEENVATAEKIRDSENTAEEKLRQLIVALMTSYADNYPLLYVYIREDLTHVEGERGAWSKYMRSLNKRYEEAVIETVRQGLDEGTFRPIGTPRVIAFGVIGMVGWTNRWFHPDKSAELASEVADSYVEIILGGLVAARKRAR